MNILIFVMIIFPQLLFAQTQTVTLLGADKGQQALVSEMSVLIDESGTQTLSNIIKDKSEFEPLEKGFAVGYTNSAHWFRVLLQRTEDAPTEWILKAGPGWVNDLRFYSKDATGHFLMQQAGDMHVNLSRSIDKQFGAYSFKVFLADTSVQEVYFRLQTRSTSLLSLSIATPEIRTQNNTEDKLVLGILIGVLFMLFMATLLTAHRPDHLIRIISAGHIFTGIIILVSSDGILAQYLLSDSPKINSYLTQVAACLLVALPILFVIVFFNTREAHPRFTLIFYGVIVSALVALLSLPFGLYTSTAPVMTLSFLMALPLVLYICWKYEHVSIPGSRALFYGFLLYFIFFIITIFGMLGIATIPNADAVTIVSIQMLSLICLIFISLQQRSNLQEKKYLDTQVEIVKSNIEVNIQKNLNQDKSTLINLVAHELTTPLAVIDSSIQALGSQHSEFVSERHRRIRMSVKHLNNILGNTFTAERYDNSPLKPRISQFLLKPLIESVTNNSSYLNRFHVDIDDDYRYSADRELFASILNNLLNNATKYSPKDTDISVLSKKMTVATIDGSLLSISNVFLCDEKPDVNQWFIKYYRHDKQAADSGLGLGLYLVKQITEAHGGTIECSITPKDKGWIVTMDLWLPNNIRTQTQ